MTCGCARRRKRMREWFAKRRDIRDARRGLKKLRYIVAVDPAAGPDRCVTATYLDGKITGVQYTDFTKQPSKT